MVAPETGTAADWKMQQEKVAEIFAAKPGGPEIRGTAHTAAKRHRLFSGRRMGQSFPIIGSITYG
jgi:hypothetical protein